MKNIERETKLVTLKLSLAGLNELFMIAFHYGRNKVKRILMGLKQRPLKLYPIPKKCRVTSSLTHQNRYISNAIPKINAIHKKISKHETATGNNGELL